MSKYSRDIILKVCGRPLYRDRLCAIFSAALWGYTNANIDVKAILADAVARRLDDSGVYAAFRDALYGAREMQVAAAAATTATDLTSSKARSIVRLLGRAPTRWAHSYLDFGCASGEITVAIAKQLRLNPAQVFGVDKVRYDSLVLPATQFAIVSAGRVLPFSDQRFDLVTCLMVLHHVPQQHHAATIRELWRVMRPGGRLVIKEHDMSGVDRELMKLVLDAQHDFFDYVIQRETWRADATPDTTYMTCTEWDNLITANGFVLDASNRPTFRNAQKNPANKFTRVYSKPKI